MKSKSSIKIVETPIIDSYDFHENNGLINPAFLDPKTTEEEITSGEPLEVSSDYRKTYDKTSGVQQNNKNPTFELQINGNPHSLASNWVYNNSCPTSSTEMDSPVGANTNTMSDVYRVPFGIRYNEHMSYEMDLSREHRNGKSCGRCWTILVRIFVWSVIVISLLGILSSIGFIIYLERFAADTCCENRLNTTRRNGSAIIAVQELPNGTNRSTVSPISTTTPQSYTRSTTYLSSTVPSMITTTIGSKMSPQLPNYTSADTSLSISTAINDLNSSPSTTTQTPMTSTKELIIMSSVKTTESGLTSTTSGSSVSNKDHILDNNSSVISTTITSLANTSESFITTQLSTTKIGVLNKSEEEVITATNAPIVTITSTVPAQTVSTQTEVQTINQTDGQNTSTTATTTVEGGVETTAEIDISSAEGSASSLSDEYIRTLFG